MKRSVNHQSLVYPGPFKDSTITTTLCQRMDSTNEDGLNIDPIVTCKVCLKILGDPGHWANRKLKLLKEEVA